MRKSPLFEVYFPPLRLKAVTQSAELEARLKERIIWIGGTAWQRNGHRHGSIFMTRKDAKFITGFIARVDMYIYPVDRHGIVSFIHGYETGSRGRCKFTPLVAKQLTEHFRIPHNSFGWPRQIEDFASQQGLKWHEAFIRVASAFLEGGLRVQPANHPKRKKLVAPPKNTPAKRKPGRLSKK